MTFMNTCSRGPNISYLVEIEEGESVTGHFTLLTDNTEIGARLGRNSVLFRQ